MPGMARAYVQMTLKEAAVVRSQPMADSRDTIVVHDMFRREFNAIPGLVSGVPEDDPANAAARHRRHLAVLQTRGAA